MIKVSSRAALKARWSIPYRRLADSCFQAAYFKRFRYKTTTYLVHQRQFWAIFLIQIVKTNREAKWHPIFKTKAFRTERCLNTALKLLLMLPEAFRTERCLNTALKLLLKHPETLHRAVPEYGSKAAFKISLKHSAPRPCGKPLESCFYCCFKLTPEACLAKKSLRHSCNISCKNIPCKELSFYTVNSSVCWNILVRILARSCEDFCCNNLAKNLARKSLQYSRNISCKKIPCKESSFFKVNSRARGTTLARILRKSCKDFCCNRLTRTLQSLLDWSQRPALQGNLCNFLQHVLQ